jgi:thioredoxin reductase (NADPH)
MLDIFLTPITDEHMKTSLEGVFAAGDVRSKEIRQIDVACGEATIAAISVRDYLKSRKINSNTTNTTKS